MTSSKDRKRSRPWRTALIAGMASYLDGGAIITTGIALVLYQDELGISPSTFGLLSGILILGVAVGAVIGGRLGDRYGRRRVFTVTLGVYAIGIALLAFAVAPWMLFAGAALAGIAAGADLPVSLALISEEAPANRKGQMIAFSQLLWLVGICVSVALSVVVSPLGVLGARILYGHLLVVALIVLVFRFTLPESRAWQEARTHTVAGQDQIDLRRLGSLFVRPVVAAVLATGFYYALWNIGTNTLGQFNTFLFVNLAGAPVQLASLVGLAAFPIGLVGAFVFMKIVDRPARRGWFIFGTIATLLAFAFPLALGVTVPSMVAFALLIGIGGAFSGEGIYKVWVQEKMPTLLRGSAQGVTIAFGRVAAALFAIATPTLALIDGRLLFGILLAFGAIAAVIGLIVIPRLPAGSAIEGMTEPAIEKVS